MKAVCGAAPVSIQMLAKLMTQVRPQAPCYTAQGMGNLKPMTESKLTNGMSCLTGCCVTFFDDFFALLFWSAAETSSSSVMMGKLFTRFILRNLIHQQTLQ